ncbi:hypothetical protein [Pseudomonas akapageensis]|uniref:hypothetical protein n=1 Tax=Pseudomonas akapageensis TaxID=2609961 RepID=UPI00140DF7F6|nr:hypothetical protein [Pseudomonas akapageensis]
MERNEGNQTPADKISRVEEIGLLRTGMLDPTSVTKETESSGQVVTALARGPSPDRHGQ